MRVLGSLFLTTLLLGVLSTCPVAAQAQQASGPADSRALSSTALNDALAGHESAVDRQRAELTALLSGPQVRDVASERGIDMGRVASMAAGLSDAEVRGITPLVAEVVRAQDGGLGTITISVAVVIIVLLVLILAT
jgi:hypothetical protein